VHNCLGRHYLKTGESIITSNAPLPPTGRVDLCCYVYVCAGDRCTSYATTYNGATGEKAVISFWRGACRFS
jgi:hypothetical protein